MNHIRKGRVFEDKLNRKKFYKIISLVENFNDLSSTVVVFREVFMDFGNDEIDWLFYPTAKWQYLKITDFDERFVLFIADEETMFRIREGLYE